MLLRRRKILRFIFSKIDSKFNVGDTRGHILVTFRCVILEYENIDNMKYENEIVPWLTMNS